MLYFFVTNTEPEITATELPNGTLKFLITTLFMYLALIIFAWVLKRPLQRAWELHQKQRLMAFQKTMMPPLNPPNYLGATTRDLWNLKQTLRQLQSKEGLRMPLGRAFRDIELQLGRLAVRSIFARMLREKLEDDGGYAADSDEPGESGGKEIYCNIYGAEVLVPRQLMKQLENTFNSVSRQK